MAINKKLIHFKTKAAFDKEYEAGNIKETSICWIKDSQQIFTHDWGLQGVTPELLEKLNLLEEELNSKQDKLPEGNINEILTMTKDGPNWVNFAQEITGYQILYTTHNNSKLSISNSVRDNYFAETFTNISSYIISNEYYPAKGYGLITLNTNYVPSGILHSQDNLKSILVSGKFSLIKYGAFAENPNLLEITLTNGITEIEGGVFHSNSLLKDIIIPNSVEKIGGACFYNCTSLKTCSLPNNTKFTILEAQLFESCTNLLNIQIPDSITTINFQCFASCNSLTFIKIPDKVTTLGNRIFANCINLLYIDLGKVKGELSQTVTGCINLRELIIPSGVTYLNSTFNFCQKIERLVIPSTVKKQTSLAHWGDKAKIIDSSVGFLHNFPDIDNLETLILRYNGVIKDVDTYVTTYKVEDSEINRQIGKTFENNQDDGIAPVAENLTDNLETYIGKPNNLLKIFVPENQLINYQKTYPTLKNYFHPITGEDTYAYKDDLINTFEIVLNTSQGDMNAIVETPKDTISKIYTALETDPLNTIVHVTIRNSFDLAQSVKANYFNTLPISNDYTDGIGKSPQLMATLGNNTFLITIDSELNTSIEVVLDDAITMIDELSEKVKEVENLPKMINVTWEELKNLRDEKQLIPGMFYRITDYGNTTYSFSWTADGTTYNGKMMNRRFDIVVMALSNQDLSEEASATWNDSSTYFDYCNLAKWKIWYKLDNDTSYSWANSIYGKGIITRMIDEFGNDCPYDFKNIQFARYSNSGSYTDFTTTTSASPVYKYTFDKSLMTASTTVDATLTSGLCFDNVIKQYMTSDGKIHLNNIVFYVDNTTTKEQTYGNVFDNDCYNFTFGKACQGNSFGILCHDNTFNISCQKNIFGNECQSNTFGSSCQRNIFGNTCAANQIGSSFSQNTIGTYFFNNVIGASCTYNQFGNWVQRYNIGSTCQYNIITQSRNGTMGNISSNNQLICANSIDVGTYFSNNILNNVTSFKCGNYCMYNQITNASEILFGTQNNYTVNFNDATTVTPTNYVTNITIDSNVNNIALYSKSTTSATNFITNIHVHSGTHGGSAKTTYGSSSTVSSTYPVLQLVVDTLSQEYEINYAIDRAGNLSKYVDQGSKEGGLSNRVTISTTSDYLPTNKKTVQVTLQTNWQFKTDKLLPGEELRAIFSASGADRTLTIPVMNRDGSPMQVVSGSGSIVIPQSKYAEVFVTAFSIDESSLAYFVRTS